MTFFVAAFSMLAKLVQVDGRISEEEIASIERFMREDLRLSPASRRVAIDIFNTAKTSPHAFDDFAFQFYGAFQQRPEILEFMIDILMRVAMADRDFSAGEEALIQRAAQIFHLSEPGYQNLRSRHVQTDDRFYRALGVTAEASDDEIKHRYRALVKEFHPDRIASKGLPEEFTDFAEKKFREIQEAYEAIKKERGIA